MRRGELSFLFGSCWINRWVELPQWKPWLHPFSHFQYRQKGKWVQSTASGQWLSCTLFPHRVDKSRQIQLQHKTVFMLTTCNAHHQIHKDFRQYRHKVTKRQYQVVNSFFFFYINVFLWRLSMSSGERRCFVLNSASSFHLQSLDLQMNRTSHMISKRIPIYF